MSWITAAQQDGVADAHGLHEPDRLPVARNRVRASDAARHAEHRHHGDARVAVEEFQAGVATIRLQLGRLTHHAGALTQPEDTGPMRPRMSGGAVALEQRCAARDHPSCAPRAHRRCRPSA